MSNGVPIQRRPRPPVSKNSNFISRDEILARVDALLAKPGPPPFPKPAPETAPRPPDLINLEAIVEEVAVPPYLTREAAPPARAEAFPEEPPARRASLLGSIFQALILLLVLSWVFFFGLIMGRNPVWESGLSRDVFVWLEREFRDKSEELRMLGNSLTDPAGPRESSAGAASEAASKPAVSAAVRLAENVAGDWSGRQWFAQETARERTGTAPADDEDDFDIVEEPLPGISETVVPPPAPAPGLPPVAAGSTPAPSAGESSAAAPPAPAVSDFPTLPPPVGGPVGRFAVQVFLVFDQAEAQRRVERLERNGFTAYSYQGESGRIPVRVGHFTTRQSAEEALARLQAMGYTGAYISTLSE